MATISIISITVNPLLRLEAGAKSDRWARSRAGQLGSGDKSIGVRDVDYTEAGLARYRALASRKRRAAPKWGGKSLNTDVQGHYLAKFAICDRSAVAAAAKLERENRLELTSFARCSGYHSARLLSDNRIGGNLRGRER